MPCLVFPLPRPGLARLGSTGTAPLGLRACQIHLSRGGGIFS